ncbi:Transport and Golgi organisation 2 [Paramicrobacterium humi]|uniref:Transport and Golgi organisation 2 n=1 Tax=Paramicrobacterium humi TaxID=640635 RepID=A0A1H4K2J4_9MICO|nr:NRDE family protein [Microbacterium humi]SEB52506.1 Transport and Golgi organisation 2 [Microbacterium humi]
MCTVFIRVPDAADAPIRLLAVRDEDPARAWNPLGAWWPDTLPGVLGVRDVRAGGAWLAADPARSRLAVLLNRADVLRRPDSELVSRGAIVLDSVAGRSPAEEPPAHGFNLVEIDAHGARVITWNGVELTTTPLEPGSHMIAHDGLDDPATPRIARWLDEFRDTGVADGERWWEPWLQLVARSAALDPTDDDAIIRDNRAHGFPTLSLLACTASVSSEGVDLTYGELTEPGHWGGLEFAPA